MRKRDKKRYVKLTYAGVGSVTLDPVEVTDFLLQADEPPIKREDIYLTDAQYEALPEFES